jgi:hypothetical protein
MRARREVVPRHPFARPCESPIVGLAGGLLFWPMMARGNKLLECAGGRGSKLPAYSDGD